MFCSRLLFSFTQWLQSVNLKSKNFESPSTFQALILQHKTLYLEVTGSNPGWVSSDWKPNDLPSVGCFVVYVKWMDGLSSLSSPRQNGHCQTPVGILSPEAKTSIGNFISGVLQLPSTEYRHGAREEGRAWLERTESLSSFSTFLTKKEDTFFRPRKEVDFLICHLLLQFNSAEERGQFPAANDACNVLRNLALLTRNGQSGEQVDGKGNRTKQNRHAHVARQTPSLPSFPLYTHIHSCRPRRSRETGGRRPVLSLLPDSLPAGSKIPAGRQGLCHIALVLSHGVYVKDRHKRWHHPLLLPTEAY